MRKILVFGATSAIAEQTARIWAERGDELYLVARDIEKLSVVADDLRVRGARNVYTGILDVCAYDVHAQLVRDIVDTLGGLDVVLIAHGSLPDQAACEEDFSFARRELEVNALGTISLLTELANVFQRRGNGCLAVISSVAGDRGRQSNYVYGTAKGAVAVFMQGLRNRLRKSGVQVLTIKPGFVDTPMTVDFQKGLLWASPDRIARGIVAAVDNRKDVVYLPWFWRYIMLLIRLIPERVFKRLNL